ncbi:bonsai isoform X2 [Wolffia australiana]
MSGAAAELLSLGILLDILDEEWMRDTLPHDEIPLPAGVALRVEDAEDQSPESQQVETDTWRDLALDNH